MMKYIGTIAGAVLGLLVLHSFLALLMGAMLGYGLDVTRNQKKRARRAADRRFVAPLFALLGAVAKSDGRVSEGEIAVAERMMQRLQLNKEWRGRAIAAFNEGKQPGFDVHAAINRLQSWTGGYRDLAYPMLDVLVDTVLADGAPNDAKLQLLRSVARGLRISELQLMAMIAMKTAQTAQAAGRHGAWHSGPRAAGGGNGAGGRRSSSGNGISDPYAVLGLARDADNATVKRTYRKLMSEHHPDRLGDLPEDLQRRAQERASTINAAYDQIKQQRGIK